MDRKIYTDNVYYIMRVKYPNIWERTMRNDKVDQWRRLQDLYVMFESISEGTMMSIEQSMRKREREYYG